MQTLDLSLRQRKLLFMLQNQTDYITSIQLAEALNVSSRTIRNDIREINRLLAPYRASVRITHAKGVLLEAEDPRRLRSLIRSDVAYFMTRSERIRHLAIRLCVSDTPLDLYDLEEEMFVSRTALMSDIQQLKKLYCTAAPHIRLIVGRNHVAFEQDELKLRSVLLKLFHQDWDYNSEGNAFYGYHFLDEALLKSLLQNLARILAQFNILLDDPTLVALELTLAIMHHRNLNGHPFPDILPPPAEDTDVWGATEAIFALVEAQTGLRYPSSEHARVYQFITNSFMTYPLVGRAGEDARITDTTRQVASIYFSEIREVFGLDFSQDPEVSRMLTLFFHQVLMGNSIFFQHQDFRAIKEALVVEYELAYLFQMLSPDYRGRRLTEIELSNLTLCLSRALREYLDHHPERKLHAVLFSHRNIVSAWELSSRLNLAFQSYLVVRDYKPVNFKTSYDYSDVDLVFTTVGKDFPLTEPKPVLKVSDGPNAEFSQYLGQVRRLALNNIWPMPDRSFAELFRSAVWHENAALKDRFQIIRTLCADFLRSGAASDIHLRDILEREAESSFALRSGIVLLHTLLPAGTTGLSVMTLRHRVEWDEYKISTAIMLMYTEADRNLLFHMKARLNAEGYDPEVLREKKTREELLPYLLEGIDSLPKCPTF